MLLLSVIAAAPLMLEFYRFDNGYTEAWYQFALKEIVADTRTAERAPRENYAYRLQIFNAETGDSAHVKGIRAARISSEHAADQILDYIPLQLYEGSFHYQFSVEAETCTLSLAGDIEIQPDTLLFYCSDLVPGKRSSKSDFVFHDYAFMPAVGLQFSQHDTLISYVEIYGFIPDSLYYEATYTIVDSTGHVVLATSRERLKYAYTQVDTYTIPLADFADGTYGISLEICDPAVHSTLWCMHSFTVRREFSLATQQQSYGALQYVMSPDQYRKFTLLSEDEKQAYIDIFLSEEEYTKYQMRILEADEKFSSRSMLGRDSERGQYYIRHGKPDYVERFAMIEWARPLELWHYSSSNAEVLFCDTREDGNYQLITSLREGEFTYVLEFGLRDPEKDIKWPWLFKIAPGTYWGQKSRYEQLEDMMRREDGIEDGQ